MASSARTRSLVPVAAAVVGIALIALAVLRVTSSFTEEVGVRKGVEVTVECGNAFEARDLDEVQFSDPDDFDVLEGLSAPAAHALTTRAADACEDAGTSRILLSGVLGVVGLAGVIAAVVLFRRRSAAGADPAGTSLG